MCSSDLKVNEAECSDVCSSDLADFDVAKIIIAVKESEHRPLVERRFPTVAPRVRYWHVDDVGFAPPSLALAMLDQHVRELIENLQVR